MNKHNVISIDLAKNIFEVCVISPTGKLLSRHTLKRNKLASFMVKQAVAVVAMEACGGAHHWARMFSKMGHQVVMLAPKVVTPFRQGQKTDANDALAIGEAAVRPALKRVAVKSLDQQSLQSMLRMREHLSHNLTASSNMIRGLLLEYGEVFRKGFAALKQHLPLILEDAENELPMAFRQALACMWQHWLIQEQTLKDFEKPLHMEINSILACRRLQQLEGVGPINAAGLYIVLGDGKSFSNGREASAYIGLTPKQHSSGGKVSMMGIGKTTGHKQLRSTLIQGARSIVHKKCPANAKGEWLHRLILRAGHGKASVALANRTVRQAWAMLNYGEEYDENKGAAVMAA